MATQVSISSAQKIYEVVLHGRGGQGSVTAAELLCEFAYASGFHDTLAIPIIGAERRGSPVKAFAKLSLDKEIKNYSNVRNPDYTLIFDPSLLPLPGVLESITSGAVLLNTRELIDIKLFLPQLSIYRVDATGISLDLKLVVAGSPVLNVPMLGALAKIMPQLKLETIKKVLEDHFGAKADLNYKTAERAYNEVQQVR